MSGQVAILHGWSDTSKSFLPMRQYLIANGYSPVDIQLADYISLDDDVRIEDVAKRMQVVVSAKIESGELIPPFDLIVHSTGGLVAREWIVTNFPDGMRCPVKRLIMLAPANFGSKLASMGQSMLGRVLKGWNNWFQTGEEMLLALELGSPYLWKLAQRDLIARPGEDPIGPYGPGKVWPFVIVGSRSYSDGLKQIVGEHGSDGTVRACAANMNTVGLTIDFTAQDGSVSVSSWGDRSGGTKFPIAILPDRDHGSITRPDLTGSSAPDQPDQLSKAILRALKCETENDYQAIAAEWQTVSDGTAALGDDKASLDRQFGPNNSLSVEQFHRHMQLNVYVRDDYGNAIDDYFLEFYDPDKSGTADSVAFHGEVLEDVHKFGKAEAFRCLYVDHAELSLSYYTDGKGGVRNLAVSISAAPPGKNVKYFDSLKDGAKGEVLVHSDDPEVKQSLTARLFRNTTHLIEVVVPRRPIDKVFRLSRVP